MAKSSLDRLAETEEIGVIWKSFELRPKNAPPIPPEQLKAYKERIEAAWPNTKRIAKEMYGVDMEHHRLGMNSRLALEGAKFAEEQGLGEPYHNAMFRAHFVEDRDFGELETLSDLAEEAGLNRAEFVAAIEEGRHAQQVDTDVTQAHAYGIRGVPALIIQGKYFASGAQTLEALQDIVRQVKEREEMEA